MAEHNETGKWGEEMACRYLEEKGYMILDRNWYYQKAELDIVAMDGGTVVFVGSVRDLSDGAAMDLLDHFLVADLVAAFVTGNDGQVFFPGHVGNPPEAAASALGGVDGPEAHVPAELDTEAEPIDTTGWFNR